MVLWYYSKMIKRKDRGNKMSEDTTIDRVRDVLKNTQELKEIADNLDSIIDSSFELGRLFFKDTNPEMVFLENDVLDAMEHLEGNERGAVINKALRYYFSKQKEESIVVEIRINKVSG